jgi:hypothetical protein
MWWVLVLTEILLGGLIEIGERMATHGTIQNLAQDEDRGEERVEGECKGKGKTKGWEIALEGIEEEDEMS